MNLLYSGCSIRLNDIRMIVVRLSVAVYLLVTVYLLVAVYLLVSRSLAYGSVTRFSIYRLISRLKSSFLQKIRRNEKSNFLLKTKVEMSKLCS